MNYSARGERLGGERIGGWGGGGGQGHMLGLGTKENPRFLPPPFS